MRGAVLLGALIALVVPSAASAATCSDHSSQAQAQRVADTRDGDRDGLYCESLPCPCLRPGAGPSPPPAPPPRSERSSACTTTAGIVPVGFSGTKYPNIRRHALSAIADGWPQTLVLNRQGADARRDRLLRGIATRPEFDRDEYPPAVGRGRANGGLSGLVRGRSPLGWRGSVAYVSSSENRSHGSVLGAKLRRFCNGRKFQYVFF